MGTRLFWFIIQSGAWNARNKFPVISRFFPGSQNLFPIIKIVKIKLLKLKAFELEAVKTELRIKAVENLKYLKFSHFKFRRSIMYNYFM